MCRSPALEFQTWSGLDLQLWRYLQGCCLSVVVPAVHGQLRILPQIFWGTRTSSCSAWIHQFSWVQSTLHSNLLVWPCLPWLSQGAGGCCCSWHLPQDHSAHLWYLKDNSWQCLILVSLGHAHYFKHQFKAQLSHICVKSLNLFQNSKSDVAACGSSDEQPIIKAYCWMLYSVIPTGF